MKLAVPLASVIVACVACSGVLAQATRSELKPIAFSALDSNKDGKISRNEARADPELSADFDMLDLNHDGYLSPLEFQAWPRAMKTNTTRDPTTAPGGSAGAQHMPGR